jgi:hypothetical protein
MENCNSKSTQLWCEETVEFMIFRKTYKVCAIKMAIRPLLLSYGSECWLLTRKDENIL